jgi:hypothetical protein
VLVYESLLKVSRNHMRAFVCNLEKLGGGGALLASVPRTARQGYMVIECYTRHEPQHSG